MSCKISNNKTGFHVLSLAVAIAALSHTATAQQLGRGHRIIPMSLSDDFSVSGTLRQRSDLTTQRSAHLLSRPNQNAPKKF